MTDDPELLGLIEDLSVASSDFVRFWKQHDVLERQGGERGFIHPPRDEVPCQQVTLRPGEDENIKFVMLRSA